MNEIYYTAAIAESATWLFAHRNGLVLAPFVDVNPASFGEGPRALWRTGGGLASPAFWVTAALVEPIATTTQTQSKGSFPTGRLFTMALEKFPEALRQQVADDCAKRVGDFLNAEWPVITALADGLLKKQFLNHATATAIASAERDGP